MIGLGGDFVTHKANEGKVGINGFVGCGHFESNGKPADPSDIRAMQRMIRYQEGEYSDLLNNIPTS